MSDGTRIEDARTAQVRKATKFRGVTGMCSGDRRKPWSG